MTSNRGGGKPSVIGLVECPADTQQARFRSGSEDTQGRGTTTSVNSADRFQSGNSRDLVTLT
jgi:hypothetical protein